MDNRKKTLFDEAIINLVDNSISRFIDDLNYLFKLYGLIDDKRSNNNDNNK